MTLDLEHTRAEAGEHLVHFYEDDRALAHTVGTYLAEAIALRAPAVAIATRAHLKAFMFVLEAAGSEPAQPLEDGSLIFLDADETLARFTIAGRIDPHAFRQVIGEILSQASAAGGPGPVRAYGEMVGVLWESGDVLAAIELEQLWNDLGHELEFSLLCGYHSATVSSPDQTDALRQVCHLHSSVLEAPTHFELSRHFPAELDSPRAARHFAAEALRSWGFEGIALDDAQLVLSELTTNAVLHARTPFSVTISSAGSRVWIGVQDASQLRPIVRHPGVMALSGRGMQLVEELAIDWGVDVSAHGKMVWASFAA